MSIHAFEVPFRPAYETKAGLGWIAAAIGCFYVYIITPFPGLPFAVMLSFCALMAAFRLVQGIPVRARLSALKKGGIEFLDADDFVYGLKHTLKDGIWLGEGFTLKREEINRTHEILRRGPEQVIRKMPEGGAYWLQAVSSHTNDLVLPWDCLNGHTLVVGTTRVGKTRLFDLLIHQAIARQWAVLIIDPKGDKGLREGARKGCLMHGEPDKYVMFDPAQPHVSACIDTMYNWNRPTELASRVAALIPSETGADPFTAFGWKALNDVINGLVETGDRPNLLRLRRYIEGGPGQLLLRALRTHFEKHVEKWESIAKPYISRAQNNELTAYINMYRDRVAHEFPSRSLDGLIAAHEHNREHFQKMIASLIPILSMLTSGALGDLLSPDPEHLEGRVITDLATIIRRGQVAYFGLDSLSDSTVGSAIGSMLLSDLTAVAGARYNYGVGNRQILVCIDEGAEVLNKPTIQLLNKGAGAGFNVVIATQTFADFVARTGNEANARQVLGNCNNKIVLRVVDGDTQKYVAEEVLPETFTSSLQREYRSGGKTTDPENFSGMVSESVAEESAPMIPSQLLGQLPKFHYIASLSDGRIVKGAIPILQYPDEEVLQERAKKRQSA
jgi:conjugal transfer pilus assembly protein TraD